MDLYTKFSFLADFFCSTLFVRFISVVACSCGLPILIALQCPLYEHTHVFFFLIGENLNVFENFLNPSTRQNYKSMKCL